MTKERADAYKGYRDPMRSVMQKHGITTIINLQHQMEHQHCGPGLLEWCVCMC